MILIFDIEADGLLDTVTKMHCAVFKNYETGKVTPFTDGDLVVSSVCKAAEKGDLVLVGHNIIGYDLPLLEKLFKCTYSVQTDTLMSRKVQFIDTMVMSRELNPDRLGGHSLDAWGKRVGRDKPEIEDWTGLGINDYIHRCTEDVEITELTFKRLMKEAGLQT